MDELETVDHLCEALRDDSWHVLQVRDDLGRPQELSRLDAIDYLAQLCPELALPPSAMH